MGFYFPNTFANIYYFIKSMLRTEINMSNYQERELASNPHAFLSLLFHVTRLDKGGQPQGDWTGHLGKLAATSRV